MKQGAAARRVSLLCSLLLLLSQLAPSSAAAEYDDYSPNGTEELQPVPQGSICPRAMPAETVVHGNVTFLVLPEALRLQLGSPVLTHVLPSFYTLIALVGLPANALALWVLATKVELLPSTIFLMNLAASDLLLSLLLPLKAAYYFLGNHWPFGEALCRFSTAAFYGNMHCSVLLLSCISTDRYLGVAHPFFARSCRSVAFAVGACAGAWLLAALSTLPLMLPQQAFPLEGTRQTLCHDALPHEEDRRYYYYYFLVLTVCGFLAPLLVIAGTSGAVLWVLAGDRQKYATAIKLTALMLATVLLFYTPSNVLLLLHYTRRCFRARGTLYVAYMASLALSTCNSCVDPFIYYYASEEFRTKVRGRLFGRRKDSAVSLKTCKETLPAKSSHSLL